MVFHGLPGGDRRAALNGPENLAVGLERKPGPLGRLNAGVPAYGEDFGQGLGEADQGPVVGGLGNGQVEGGVGGGAGFAPLNLGLLLPKDVLEAGDVGWCCPLGGEGGHRRLNDEPELDDIVKGELGEGPDEALGRAASDNGAGARPPGDEAVELEDAQGLPDRTAAYAEPVSKFPFWGEPVTGLELALPDKLGQLDNDFFMQTDSPDRPEHSAPSA